MKSILLKTIMFSFVLPGLLPASALQATARERAIGQDVTIETYTDQRIRQIAEWDLSDVRARCKKDHGYTDEQLETYEREFKRYMTLCIVYPKISFEMFSKEVDDVWHAFILFTKQYTNFCTKIAGHYIHHSPHTEEHRPTAEQIKQSRHLFLTKYYEIFQENPPLDAWHLARGTCPIEKNNNSDCSNGCNGDCSYTCSNKTNELTCSGTCAACRSSCQNGCQSPCRHTCGGCHD